MLCIFSGIVLQAAGIFFVGLFGRDNDVPSSAVPKAAATDAKIKNDTTTITKP